MNVNEATKNAYRADSSKKEIRLYFPDLELTIGNNKIDHESMELTESLAEDESIEFIGCNASQFKITIHGISENLKNERIQAFVKVGTTTEIPLFNGVVNDVSISADKTHKTLKCYDELYTKGNIDVADWYKRLVFPVTIKYFRDNLFGEIGITQVSTALPNDNILIEKQYSPNSLKALVLIKSICQINGVFGIINRENKFEYRTIAKTETASVTEAFSYQKSLKYQEYIVNPVDRLTIRQTDQDEGVSYGDGDNTYIIQGNFFTFNLENDVLLDMAENIYPNVEGFYYTPFESDNNGLPWIECGDYVSYSVYDYENSTVGNPVYKTLTFCILSRKLFGIQNLRDSYTAEGDEFQRVFVTDLQSRIETIVEQISEITGQLEDYSLNYVVFTNPNKITINDGDTVSVWRCVFAIQKPTQVMVQIEILLDCETTESGITFNDLILTTNYYYDLAFIDSRQPKETYTDGNHILKLYYILNVDNPDITHEFEVRLKASGGKAVIDIGQGLFTLVGQKIVGDVWDGRFNIEQELPVIAIGHPSNGITMVNYYDNVVVGTQIPIGAEIDEEISEISVGHPTHGITMIAYYEQLAVETEEV